jgi:hypothetical protein
VEVIVDKNRGNSARGRRGRREREEMIKGTPAGPKIAGSCVVRRNAQVAVRAAWAVESSRLDGDDEGCVEAEADEVDKEGGVEELRWRPDCRSGRRVSMWMSCRRVGTFPRIVYALSL